MQQGGPVTPPRASCSSPASQAAADTCTSSSAAAEAAAAETYTAAAAAPPATPASAPPPPAAAAAPATPPPTPLEQRTWRRAAQSQLRSTITSFKDACSIFSTASDSGLPAATRLVNLLLRGAYLPQRPLGVLEGRREVVVAAAGKLLRQQQGELQEVARAVAQAAAAAQAMVCAFQELQQLLTPTSAWQAATPVFHTTPLPQALQLLQQVAMLHTRELAVQQHLLLGFHGELALSWEAAGPEEQAAAGVAPPCLATGQLPLPPVWQGEVLDPTCQTWQQAQQQLARVRTILQALPEQDHPGAPVPNAAAAAAAAAVASQDAESSGAATAAHHAVSSSSSGGVAHTAATAPHSSQAAASPAAAAPQALEHAYSLAFSAALRSKSTSRRPPPPAAAAGAGGSGEEGDALRSCLFVPLSVWKAAACLEGGRVGDVLQLLTDDMAGF